MYVLQSNPPELKLLVAASGDGVNLKLFGTVHLNALTGQLMTTFEEYAGRAVHGIHAGVQWWRAGRARDTHEVRDV